MKLRVTLSLATLATVATAGAVSAQRSDLSVEEVAVNDIGFQTLESRR